MRKHTFPPPSSPDSPSRDRRGDARRLSLMDAAEQLFLAHGYGGTTVDQIAARAGIAKGTFYLAFRSKEALLHALRRRFEHGFIAAIARAQASLAPDDWPGRLDTWVAAGAQDYFHRVALHDALFRTGIGAPVTPDPDIIPADLEALLRKGHAARAWVVDDPAFTGALLFSAFHTAIEQDIPGHPPRHPDWVIPRTQAFFRTVLDLKPR